MKRSGQHADFPTGIGHRAACIVDSRRQAGGAKVIPTLFEQTDRRVAAFMQRWGIPALRVSLAAIFVWFGILKPLGISAAAPLVH